MAQRWQWGHPCDNVTLPALQLALHDAVALVILLSRLAVALLQLRHHLGIQLLTLRQLRRVVRQPCLDRCPHHLSWQVHVLAVLQKRQLFFVWRRIQPLFCPDSTDPRLPSTDSSRRSSCPRNYPWSCAQCPVRQVQPPTCLAISSNQPDVSTACRLLLGPSCRLASICGSFRMSCTARRCRPPSLLGVEPKGGQAEGALLRGVYGDITRKETCTCRVRAHGGGWWDDACADVASRAGAKLLMAIIVIIITNSGAMAMVAKIVSVMMTTILKYWPRTRNTWRPTRTECQ